MNPAKSISEFMLADLARFTTASIKDNNDSDSDRRGGICFFVRRILECRECCFPVCWEMQESNLIDPHSSCRIC